MSCVLCLTTEVYKKHIRELNLGGVDEPFNVIFLCKEHLDECNSMGILSFIRKHYLVGVRVKEKGWILKSGRLYNDKFRFN
jgi:hypothetical protein